MTVDAFLAEQARPDEPVWLAIDRRVWGRMTAEVSRVGKLPAGGVRLRGWTPDPEGDWTIIAAHCQPDGPFDTCVVRVEPGAPRTGRRPTVIQASCTCKPGGLVLDPPRLPACIIELDAEAGTLRCVARTESSCTGTCTLRGSLEEDGTQSFICACV